MVVEIKVHNMARLTVKTEEDSESESEMLIRPSYKMKQHVKNVIFTMS